VDKYFTLGLLRQIALELLDLGAFAADDDARTRRAYRDAKLVARTVELNRAHTGRLQTAAETFLQLEIFLQQFGVTLLGEPTRAPWLGDADAETVRMNFL